ncbi:MAG: DUF4832 domain-containing protein [Tabrizicola sp.]|nr:DUF4832 domain-containing protein [Tabrizicola sp.]
MGYRLRLVTAEIADGGAFRVSVANDGWARPVQPRRLVLTAYQDGSARAETQLTGTLAEIGAGEEKTFSGTLPALSTADRICLSAPDQSPRLGAVPAYAIRFANGEAEGQGWDVRLAAFCF